MERSGTCRHPPLVLSVALARRDPSARWKETVEPRAGRFMHHLELETEAAVDDQVVDWIREAWALARAGKADRQKEARPRKRPGR
jgi:hypothetical protein